MNRTILMIAFGLLIQATASAQIKTSNAESKTSGSESATPYVDKLFDELSHRPHPSYRRGMDSLMAYVKQNYGGSGINKAKTIQFSAPTNGSDDKLRRVSRHIVERLSQFPTLVTLSERTDNGTALSGRYIAKLKPEGRDTSAYVLLKYDRQTLSLMLCQDKNISPQLTTAHRTSAEEEPTSAWHTLRDFFYLLSTGNTHDERRDWQFSSFDSNWINPFFVSSPAPAEGAKTKSEFVSMTDSLKLHYNMMCTKTSLAGCETGATHGTLSNELEPGADTCHYTYACHTLPNGLSEFIGVTHEDGKTYLVRATSQEPGLWVHPWGRNHWEPGKQQLSEPEMKLLGIYAIDGKTGKTVRNVRLTVMDMNRNPLKLWRPHFETVIKHEDIYRCVVWVPKRDEYIIKLEGDDYETLCTEYTKHYIENNLPIEMVLKRK